MTAFPVDQDRVARELWQSELRFMSWPERSWNEVVGTEREAYLALAAVAVAAVLEDLGLIEESAFRHHFPNGRSVLLTDLADLPAARKLAEKAGTGLSEERRWVGPWRVVEEGQ